MAASVVSVNKSLRVSKLVGGLSFPAWEFKEAATQSWKAGAPIIFTSGGSTVEIGGADPSSIIGIAAHNASGTTNATCRVYPAVPGAVFQGVLGGSSNPHTLAQADVGDVFGIVAAASGAWHLDADDTAVANVRARVIGLVDAVGTTDGEVLFIFLNYVQDTDTSPYTVTPVTIWGYGAAA